jgi:predicted O-methyltransferase YrrM
MGLTAQDLEQMWNVCFTENDIPEMLGVLEHAEKLDPLKTVIEIGTGLGGSARIWEAILPPGEGMYIGVEIATNTAERWSGGQEAISNFAPCRVGNWKVEWQKENVVKFKSDREVYVVIGDSASPEAAETVKRLLAGRLADMWFHDGAHWFHTALWDYEWAQHLLRTGALVCIADIGGLTENPMSGCQAVYYALPEPKSPRVRNHNQGMGIWYKQEGFVFDAQETIDRFQVVGNDVEMQARWKELYGYTQHDNE